MLINYTDINTEEDWVDLRELGVYVHNKELPESPEIKIVDVDGISSRKILIESNFTHRNISVKLAVVKYTKEDLRSTLTTLTNMLKGNFNLKFRAEENQIYRDLVLNSAIGVEQVTESVYILDLKMTAYDPFRYASAGKVVEHTGITGPKEFVLNNEGNFITRPLVKLSGTADKVNIKINGKTLTYVNLKENNLIEIDNERYTVINKANPANPNALANWRDNFVELEDGENLVNITGEKMNVNLIFEYRDTFL